MILDMIRKKERKILWCNRWCGVGVESIKDNLHRVIVLMKKKRLFEQVDLLNKKYI